MPQVTETPYMQNINNAERRGIQKGERKGLARERNLLRRLTAIRFNAEIAERLAVLLDGIDDPERLEEIGELIISSRTGAQLLKRIEDS